MIRYQSNDDYCSVDDIGAVYIFISIKEIKVTPCMSNGMDSSDEHTYGSIYSVYSDTRHGDRHNSYYGDYQDVTREGQSLFGWADVYTEAMQERVGAMGVREAARRVMQGSVHDTQRSGTIKL